MRFVLLGLLLLLNACSLMTPPLPPDYPQDYSKAWLALEPALKLARTPSSSERKLLDALNKGLTEAEKHLQTYAEQPVSERASYEQLALALKNYREIAAVLASGQSRSGVNTRFLNADDHMIQARSAFHKESGIYLRNE